jgi:general secretion pathway protein N
MPLRAILKFRRAILVGLMSLFGLISTASQQSTDFELRLGAQTDQRGAPEPTLTHIATASVPSRADLPDNGTRQALIGLGNPLWAIPLTSLTATIERPIFSPTRRRPPVAVKLAPTLSPSAVQPLLALVGAIAGETDGIAIFLDGTTKGIIRLKTGETHAGWMLQEVKAREAILQKEQNTAILALANPPAK